MYLFILDVRTVEFGVQAGMFALQMKSFYRYLCTVTLQRFIVKRLNKCSRWREYKHFRRKH